MNILRLSVFLLCSVPLTAFAADTPPDASSAAVQQIMDWLKQPQDKRPVLPEDAAKAPLSKTAVAGIKEALWKDHVATVKATRSAGYTPAEPAAGFYAEMQKAVEKARAEGKPPQPGEIKTNELETGGKKMKYKAVKFGNKPSGQPLFISMHGGGGAPARVNESQWINQIRLGQGYAPAAGIYVAPRAPTDNWNLWHESHIDTLFDRLIQDMIVFEDVDPNKVYIMGYSAGGDGVYQLAPRIADRLAAASMMAGHPNDASPLGLRNIGFTIHVGGEDGAYNRNKIAGEWGKKLDDLQKDDPKGYVHFVKVHEGRPHWMNMEDKEAIPWMEKFTRDPLPEKVVWRQSSRTHPRFYWLAVAKEEAKKGQEIVAERSGQNIKVTAKGIEHVTILLNDAMLDLDQPVTVTFNGTELPPKKAIRNAGVIRRTLEERGDPASVFCAEIPLP
jgi:hypothetical protein